MAVIRIQAVIEKGTTQADAVAIGQQLADSISSGASTAGSAVVALQTTITKLASTPVANPFAGWSASLTSVQQQIERTLAMMRQVGGAGEFASRPMNFAGTGNGNTASNLIQYGGAGGGAGAAEQEAAVSRTTRMTSAITAMSAAEQASVAAHSQAGSAVGGMSQNLAAAESGVSKLGKAWRSTTSAIFEFGASVYIIRAAMDGIAGAIAAPFKAISEADENARRFEISIASYVGGMRQARGVDQGIESNLNSTPMSLADDRRLFESLTRIAPLAEQIANATPGGMQQLTAQYSSTVAGLSALNPQVSVDQIVTGVESALLGQGRGLRTVVRIDDQQLAELVGKSGGASAFRGNPQLLLDALSKYVNLFSVSGASDQLNALPSVQIQHAHDSFSVALEQIGNSGLFDDIAGKIKLAADNLLAYVESSDYQSRAKSIGASLGVIFDNITRSALVLLQSASGADKPADTLQSVAGQVDGAFKILGAATGVLPNLASGAGQALHQLGVELAWLANKLNLTVESAAESAARIEHLTSPTTWFGGRDTAIDQISQRNTALAGMLNDATGTSFAKTFKTTYGDAVSASPDDTMLNGLRSLGVNDHPMTQLAASNPFYQTVVNDIQNSISSRGLAMSPDGQFMSPTTVRGIVTSELQKYGVLTGTPTGSAAPTTTAQSSATQGAGYALPDSVTSITGIYQRRAILDELGVLNGAESETTGASSRGTGGKPSSDADVIAVLDAMAARGVFQRMTPDDNQGFAESNAKMVGQIGAAGSAMNATAAATLFDEFQKQLSLQGVIANAPNLINQSIASGGFARAAGQRDPMLRAQQYGQAIYGTTGPAQYAAGLEGVSAGEQNFGLLNIPQNQRIGDLDAYVQAQLAGVKATGGDGAASQGFDLQRQITIYTQAVTQTQLLADATSKGSQAYQDATAKGAEYAITLQKLNAQQVANQAAQIQSNGGIITTGMTPEQVAHLSSTPQTSSLLGGQGRDGAEIALYTSALANAQQQMDAAKASLDATTNATDDQKQAFLTAAQAVDTYSGKIDALKDKNGQLTQSFVQLGNQAQTSLESTLGQALTDIELKTGNVSQAFRSLATSMLGEVNKTFTKDIFDSVLGTPNGKSGAGNGYGGLLGAASGGLQKLIGNLFHFGGSDGESKGGGPVAGYSDSLGSQGTSGASADFGGELSSGVINPNASEPDGIQGIETHAATSGSAGGMDESASSGAVAGYSDSLGSQGTSGAAADFGGEMSSGYGWQNTGEMPGGWGMDADGTGNAGYSPQYHAAGGVFSGAHLAVIAEGGQQEAVVPMPGGYLPVGIDSSGLHAILPGGRKVPAAMHAMGGVFGSSTAFTGASTSRDAGPQFGPNANPGGKTETHHYIICDSVGDAFLKGLKIHKDLLVNVVAAQGGKAGGPIRRSLQKPGG